MMPSTQALSTDRSPSSPELARHEGQDRGLDCLVNEAWFGTQVIGKDRRYIGLVRQRRLGRLYHLRW